MAVEHVTPNQNFGQWPQISFRLLPVQSSLFEFSAASANHVTKSRRRHPQRCAPLLQLQAAASKLPVGGRVCFDYSSRCFVPLGFQRIRARHSKTPSKSCSCGK